MKRQVRSKFYAVVVREGVPELVQADTKKGLQEALVDYEKSQVFLAFRGKISLLNAKSKLTF